jgi:S1-C subfamily serine protease
MITRFFLLIVLATTALAEGAKKPPVPPRSRIVKPAEPHAPVTGQPFDDNEILRYLEVEGRKLFTAGKVKPLATSTVRKCSMRLADVPTEKLPLPESAKRAEAATVIIGEFYKDKKTTGFSSAAGGFFVTETGALVTSRHVITEKDSRGFVALLRDGRVFAIRETLAVNEAEDLAVLQLDVPDGTKFPTLSLAPDPAPVGASVAVMSHPEEHFFMLTTGVVGRHTLWHDEKGESHFMSINADFAKGSSGCPVFDESGTVVGVVNNTESIYFDDDKKKQTDLQMVVKNVTPSWIVRRLFE